MEYVYIKKPSLVCAPTLGRVFAEYLYQLVKKDKGGLTLNATHISKVGEQLRISNRLYELIHPQKELEADYDLSFLNDILVPDTEEETAETPFFNIDYRLWDDLGFDLTELYITPTVPMPFLDAHFTGSAAGENTLTLCQVTSS